MAGHANLITKVLVLGMLSAHKAKLFWLFLLLLLLPVLPLLAQQKRFQNPTRIPVYRSKTDSAKITEIESAIRQLAQTTAPPDKASDSLMSLYRKLYPQAIIGFRNIYFPDREFITLDSVRQIEDLLTVKKLSVYDYRGRDLPEIIFECKNLVSLELIKTDIRKLPKRLNDLTHLKEIKIYNHRRGRVKLKKNNTVTQLVFSGASAKSLPKTYRPFAALEKLDLAGNWLTRFPQGARHNKKLRELNLQDNKLRLNRKLKKHPYVETLALQHNQIKKLPASLRSFHNLRKLNFNYNRISSVHRDIRFLTRLEFLSFYNNELKAIPQGVYELKALREIDLFYNSIETLDERIGRWKNLRMLYLSHNKILSLPESIGQLSALEGLYVWDNRISTLPRTLGEISTLRFLWLNNNNLTTLPASLFRLDHIEELDVSHNFLTTIPASVFDLNHLKILSLIDNPWDQETRDVIFRKTPLLRSRNVFVHIPDR